MTAPRTHAAPSRASVLWARPWARVLVLYLVSRAFSSALLGGALLIGSAAGVPFPGVRGQLHPTFVLFAGSWDGWFYRSIAEHGYPVALPLDAAGHVLPNAWAFLPVFPLLERALATATGLPVFAAGAIVATLAGGGAAVVLERLLAPHIGQRRALMAVALFSFGPMAFLLQVAYAESAFLLLVFGCLLAVQRRRFLAVVPLGVTAAFCRPGAIAIAAALALQLAMEWWRDRRTPRGLARGLIAVGVVGAASLAWPMIADAVTGRPDAYLDTELAWWTGWVGRPEFVPFTPWFLITSRWLGPLGVVAAVALAIGVFAWLLRGSPRALGPTIGSFAALYLLYLVAVFLPQFSLPRLLMPLAPMLGAGTFTGSLRRFRRWLGAAVALQPVGVGLLWFAGFP